MQAMNRALLQFAGEFGIMAGRSKEKTAVMTK